MKKRKKWSPLARARARERFWNPVMEQANVLVSLVYSGEDMYDIVENIECWVDSSLFGNRIENPVFKRALLSVLKEEIGLAA